MTIWQTNNGYHPHLIKRCGKDQSDDAACADKVAAETARCADVVREMLKWPYELDETTIPTIAKWLIREIEKGAE